LEVAKNADPSTSSQTPLLLAICAKADWNGVLYHSSSHLLAPLTKYYRVIVAEMEFDTVFYSNLNAIAGLYGPISVLVINAHGSPNNFALGQDFFFGEGGPALVDLADKYRISLLKHSFVEKPTIVFNSCSTGQDNSSIAGIFSKYLNAQVFAPVRPNSACDILTDDKGNIVDVCYDVPKRVYNGGDSKVIRPSECNQNRK